MKRLTRWFRDFLDLFHTIRQQNLRWQLQTHAEKMQLRTARAMSEKNLHNQLTMQQQILENELALLKSAHKSNMAMLRIKNKQAIRDYREYLAALDRLKTAITDKYRHLPEPLAFTIHYHAKQLLDEMWEAEELQHKISHEILLIQFMTSINDDIHDSADKHDDSNPLPLKTLALLKPADGHLSPYHRPGEGYFVPPRPDRQ